MLSGRIARWLQCRPEDCGPSCSSTPRTLQGSRHQQLRSRRTGTSLQAPRTRCASKSSAVIEPLPSEPFEFEPFQTELAAPAPGRLVEDNTVFVQEARIRGGEAGPDQRATVVTIANLLQEACGNHAIALWGPSEDGFGADPLMVKESLIFVLTRLQIQMDQFPKWGEVVRIATYFSAEGRVAARRDYVLTNAKTGEALGRATSTWIMMNTRTRRLSKFPDAMKYKLEHFAPKEVRYAIPEEYTRRKLPDLEDPPSIVGPVQVARRSDMDMNGHINNVVYMAWTLETVPQEVYETYHLYQIEIDFKAECMCGDTIDSLGNPIIDQPNENLNGATGALAYVHTLRKCDENKQNCTELVRARTYWRPKDSK